MAYSTVNRKGFPRALHALYAFVDALASSKKYALSVQINQTDLLAPTNQELVVPHAGYLTGFDTIVQAAITTGGAIKLQLNGVDVTGATVTHADADAAGVRKSATFTAVAVAKGDRVSVVPAAAFATAGAVNASLGFNAT